ncbi:MAG: outer membrane protein assembly factor BamB family protein [Limisphaerales bacterium]
MNTECSRQVVVPRARQGLAFAGAAALAWHALAAFADSGSGRAEWPMFRGGPALLGVAAGSLPEPLGLLWSYKTEGPIKSSPAMVDGRIFFGANDSNVYALSLAGGKKIWSFKTGGEVESSPLVLQGRVFVGSADGSLYALEADTGKRLWKYDTGDKILGAPNWVRAPKGDATWVLIGSYDFKLHCVDAATGKAVWTYESGNYINGSPAVAGGQTVFGGCDAQLHVISLATGEQVKAVDAGAYIAGSVALADHRAYFGHYENAFLCVDLEAAKIEWTYKDRAFPYFSSPAVTADHVVFGGRDKMLHCVRRADGQSVWTFATRGKVDSSPVVCGGKVVVGSDDGHLYVVSLADGKEQWSYDIGQPVSSSPAVLDGRIAIGAEDGSLYVFGAKTAPGGPSQK